MQIFWGVEAVYYGIVQVENYQKTKRPFPNKHSLLRNQM